MNTPPPASPWSPPAVRAGLFPAEALARELQARGWRIVLATDARGAQYAEPFPTEERLAVRRRPNSSSPAQRGRWRGASAP